MTYVLVSCESKTSSNNTRNTDAHQGQLIIENDTNKSQIKVLREEQVRNSTEVHASHPTNLHPDTIHYKVNEPDLILTLSYKLKEISGLTYDHDKDQLLAVNDEKGNIYHLDPSSGKIVHTFDFGKRGDYEGIEKVGDNIYVLKSNGHIYIKNDSMTSGSELLRTELREANDVEGLGYDRNTNSLLMACKGKSKISSDQDFKKTKVVYALNIEDGSCAKDPLLKISDEALSKFVQLAYANSKDLKSYVKRVTSFAPSAIAQHPFDSSFYLLSSIGKLLIIIDQHSNILSVQFLDNAIHAQPEGICFNKNGSLYIGNEGKYGIAKIYRFDRSKL